MGYTHYWYHKADQLPEDKWQEFKQGAEKIVEATSVPLSGCERYEDKPEVNDDHIWLNGVDEDGHETFAFLRKPDYKSSDDNYFAFCKTARKPYDVVVTAMLIYASAVFGDLVEISSDGTPESWQEGLELAQKALNMDLKIPITD